MTATQDDMIAELQRINAELRRERDAALSEKAALAEALATRNSEYGERIEQQSATIDVLKVMSASPGDPQPAFDLIVSRARDLCDGYSATVYGFDGTLIHWRAATGVTDDPSVREAVEAMYPMAPSREWPVGRAIMDRQIIHISDLDKEPGLNPTTRAVRNLGVRSTVAIPLLRGEQAIGVIAIGSSTVGGFSDGQIALLQTFAEQAVIAITSAETYRALQTRTSDLQETLEYQTATSDVLKVISRSAFELQPVLDTLVETAARLCDAEQALISQREGELARSVAHFGFPPEYETYMKALGAFPIDPNSPAVAQRVLAEGCLVHVHDVAAVPDYWEIAIRLGKQRTTLGVPLLREGQPIGVILLARQRVEPFTDQQIELVSTFANQAVIAIENTRLINEQREALEQQTATAEVLQVINGSPGDLTPVFDAMLEKAMRLCGVAFGMMTTFDGKRFHPIVWRGLPAALSAYFAEGGGPSVSSGMHGRLVAGAALAHVVGMKDEEAYRSGYAARRALVDLGGAQTGLAIALRKDDALLGTFMLYRQEVRPFSDKQIALLENFAAQAVIAMENARLITEQREALEQQTATAEVLQVINANPGNLTPVFDAILDKAHTLCGAVIGSLVLFDGTYFRAVATHGWPNSITALFSEPTRPNRARQSLVDGERFVQVPDIRAIGRGPNSAWGDAVVESTDARTMLLVPLRKDGALLGFISAFRPEVRAFSDKEIALLENFAAQAVIAMENARLINEQREALEQQIATAKVLQVINRSRGDLVPVFDAILESAHSLCDIARGSLELYDGVRFHAVAVRGLSAALADTLRQGYPASDNPATRPLIEGGRLSHIRDLAETDYSITRSSVETDAARTLLCVPLRRDETLLGMIASARGEVRPFSEKEIALLENFAAQAVIAMENARLINEQREALEQQTATAEVLQVINASPGNLVPVFDAVLEKAIRLCDSAFGTLTTYDGHIMHTVATCGLTPEQAALLADRPPATGQPTGRIAGGEDIVHLSDARDQDGYRAGFGPTRYFVDQVGARTAMWVALRNDKELLGILTIFRREVRAFADKEIALVRSFADQAVIAMENARLLTEQREALEQQTATSEVLQVINANPGDLAPVFDAMLEKAHSLCGAAYGGLHIAEGETFRAVAVRGVSDAFAEVIRRPLRPDLNHPVQQLIAGAPFAVVQDATKIDDPVIQSGVKLAGMRSALFVPLRKDKDLLGYVVASDPEVRAFNDKHIRLLQNFAAQAVIAMENARLLTEQQEALEQQTATADVLRAINASPGELAPVFDVIGEKAIKLCDAAAGALMLPDGDRFRAVALGGVPEAYAEFCSNSPAYGRPHPGSLPARMLAGDDVVHIKDITDVDEYAPANTPSARALAELGGGRTLLGVALRKDDKFFGMITIFRQEVKPFSHRQVMLLQSFAAQAVIAMENARLLEEVRQRQEELRITFENMGDGVAMFDEPQNLVAWNRKFQEIFNVPDALLEEHRTYAEYVRYLGARGDFGPTAYVEEQIRRFTETAGEYHSYERVRPDGRVIEIRHNPVPGGGFVLIYADITERKRSEAEIRAARDAAEEASRTIEAAYRDLKAAQANLIQAEKMASLGQLTAGIAHEIKNPLNFVNNFAALSTELIDELRDVLTPEPLGETARTEVGDLTALLKGNLEKVVQHGQRADGIVRSMLEHSRGSSGERRMVDLNVLIDEALNLAYHGARAQDQSFNITLERDYGEGIAQIEVNPQDITRVFLNVFSNGFYATTKRARDGGDAGFVPALKVTTSDAGEAVEIRVRDNGIGIPADIRDKLFQPFFTTKPTGEGTGLGLSITYDIVTQQHGGSIAVDSEVGAYSKFTIRLPRNP